MERRHVLKRIALVWGRGIALLWLAAPIPVSGQAVDRGGPSLIRSATGAFFALSVADVDSSAEWYSEKLGLEVVMEVPEGNGQPGVVVLEGGGLIVELIEHAQARSLSSLEPAMNEAQLVHGIFKVGIVVEDFEETMARLRERGVEIAYGPFSEREDQRANVLIRDNAGNLIQIFGEYAAGTSRGKESR